MVFILVTCRLGVKSGIYKIYKCLFFCFCFFTYVVRINSDHENRWHGQNYWANNKLHLQEQHSHGKPCHEAPEGTVFMLRLIPAVQSSAVTGSEERWQRLCSICFRTRWTLSIDLHGLPLHSWDALVPKMLPHYNNTTYSWLWNIYNYLRVHSLTVCKASLLQEWRMKRYVNGLEKEKTKQLNASLNKFAAMQELSCLQNS